MTHAAVLERWHEFSEPLEGRVLYMYLDILALVTTGVGNLIDTPAEAVKLPWKMPDGSLAPADVVRGDWHALKAQPALAKLHHKYAARVTRVRLTDADVDALVRSKLESNAKHLERYHFPRFRTFPADAQLAILSMAWACGPDFPRKFTNLTRVANAGDWLGAVASCKIREAGNPGVVPRNKANRLCFANAAAVVARGLPVDVLHWPGEPEEAFAPSELPTVPDLEPPPAFAPTSSAPEPITDADRARVAALQVDVVGALREDLRDDLKGEP